MTESQRDALRGLALLALAGAIGFGLYLGGYPLWLRWQRHQALAQAAQFAAAKDYPNALLALRRALDAAPNDPVTWQLAIGYLAQFASPEATLDARWRLLQLTPHDNSDRTALVRQALLAGRYHMADAAMAGFGEAVRHSASFYRLAVAVAAAEGRSDEMQAWLAKLIAADPKDENARFTYASLRIWSPAPAVRDAARDELGALLSDRNYRVRAAIELLSESARTGDPIQVQEVLIHLLGVFAPRAIPDFSAPTLLGWTALIAGVKAAAVNGAPSDPALVARWLADMGRRPEAIAWLGSLPGPWRTSPVVADISAELEAEEGDLSALGRLLQDGAWGAWPAEARRLALASRAETVRSHAARGQALWAQAIAAASNSPAGLRALVRLAGIWRDSDGAERALQKYLDRDPGSFWAYRTLAQNYRARGDLLDLWRLYGRWRAEAPDDEDITARWLLLGCLLDRVSPETYTIAARLGSQSPLCVTARAATLWRQGRADLAWSALAALPAPPLQDPTIAFWVAVVGADAGQRAAALPALASARRQPLSSEQASLLDEASEKLEDQSLR